VHAVSYVYIIIEFFFLLAMRESFSVVLANTGEIRKEYELELQKVSI